MQRECKHLKYFWSFKLNPFGTESRISGDNSANIMVANARDPFVNKYSDIEYTGYIRVTSWWTLWGLKLPASRLFVQPFVQAPIKENIKAPHHWPFWGESTGHRWIPLTKARWRGNCSHLMTSWWKYAISFTRKDFNCLRLPSAWKSWEMGMQIHVSQNKCMVINDWHKSPNVSFETDDHTLLTVMMFQSRFLYSWIDGLSGLLISGRCMLISLSCIMLKYCRSLFSIMKMRHSDNKLMMRKQHSFHRHVPTLSCHIIHSRFVVVASRVRSCYFNIETFCATYIHNFLS